MSSIQNNLSIQDETALVPEPSKKRPLPPELEKTDYSSQAVFSKITKWEEASPKFNQYLKLKIQFEEAKKNYPLLFACNAIKEADQTFDRMPDVDMDKKLIASITDFPQIGTSGVCDCLAYCMRGQTKQGEIFLGIAHSPGLDPETVIQSLSDEFLKKGCLKDTLSLYVIGGCLPHTHNEYGSVEDEIEVLSLSKKYPIHGVRFNEVIGDESSLSIVLTADGLYYSEKNIFSPLPNYEDAGDWI